jgi:hypothetical protein
LSVALLLLLITAKAEVAQAKAEAAAVTLRATERETEANRIIKRVGELERDALETQRRRECLEHLRWLDSAKEQWAMDAHKGGDTSVSMDALVAEGYLKAPVACPSGGRIKVQAVKDDPYCTEHGTIPLKY